MPKTFIIIVHVMACLCCLALGYHAGRESHQNVNDLIAVGFHVIDEDGYECSRFDEGLFTLMPDYYTYQDKPHD